MEKTQGYTIFGRQVVYVIGTNVATVILGIIQIPIVTKALGTSQYGAWSLIITAISLVTPFVTLAFGMSIIRFLAAEKDINKIREDFFSACLLVLLSGVIFSLLFFLLSGYLATYILKNANLSTSFRLSSILILLNSMFVVLLAFFRRASQIGIFSLLNLGLNVLQVGLTIVFISLGYGLAGVIEAAIFSTAALNIICIFIIFKQIGFRRPKFSNIKVYLKWGIPMTPSAAIQWIINASDRYIVNYFLGASATGIYNAADVMGGYASFAILPVGIVLFPIISKAYDEGKLGECRDYFRYSLKYLMMFTIPAVAGLSVLAKPLLHVLTTGEFISGSSVLVFATFGALSYCFYQMFIYVIYLIGKTQIEVRLLAVAAVLNIMFNLILIPHIGIIGAELASVVTYSFLGVSSLVVARRYLKFDLSLFFLAKSALSSGFMALVIWLINPQTILMVFLSILAGIITYFGALLLVRGFSKTELAFFTNFIRNGIIGKLQKRN